VDAGRRHEVAHVVHLECQSVAKGLCRGAAVPLRDEYERV
jgi:hypothetical protein